MFIAVCRASWEMHNVSDQGRRGVSMVQSTPENGWPATNRNFFGLQSFPVLEAWDPEDTLGEYLLLYHPIMEGQKKKERSESLSYSELTCMIAYPPHANSLIAALTQGLREKLYTYAPITVSTLNTAGPGSRCPIHELWRTWSNYSSSYMSDKIKEGFLKRKTTLCWLETLT